MVETMRYADPGDCEEMAQAQEAFFTELSKYLSLARSFSENQEWSKPHKKSKIQFFNYIKTNSTVQKYYERGVIWMVTPKGFIHGVPRKR